MTHWLLSCFVSNGLAALVIAAAAWLITCRFKSPALAHALWLLVLLKLLLPPLVDVPLPSLRTIDEPVIVRGDDRNTISENLPVLPSVIERPSVWGRESVSALPIPMDDGLAKSTPEPLEIEPSLAFEAASIEPAELPRATLSISEFLCIAWAAGVVVWLATAAVRIGRFRKMLRRTRPASAKLQQEVEQLAAELGLRRGPQVRVATGIVPPLTWALWGRPVILLPKRLLDQLTDAERQTLLAHELAHLKRRDHLIRWLELLAVGVNWWQPVAWFARARLHRASEECCDAWVVRRFPHLARAYAETLLKTVDFLAAAQPALPIGSTGFGAAHCLKRRFEMILHERKNDRMTWLARLIVLVIAGLVLPTSVKSLWAEPPKPAPATETIDLDSVKRQLHSAAANLRVITDKVARHPGAFVTDESNPTKPTSAAEDEPARAIVPAGYRAMTLQYTSRFPLKPGDRLDVLGLWMEKENEKRFTEKRFLAEDLHVMTVEDIIMPDGSTLPWGKSISVLVSPEQFKTLAKIEEGKDKGVFEFAVRKPSKLDPNKQLAAKSQTRADDRLEQLEATVAKLTEALDVLLADANRRQRAENPSNQNTRVGSLTQSMGEGTAAKAKPNAEASETAPAKGKGAFTYSTIKRDLDTNMTLCATNFNRMIAAEKQVEAVQSAWKVGSATLDLLLEAQRREVDAKCSYARTIADLSNVTGDETTIAANERRYQLMNLVARKEGRDKSLQLWKDIHALFVAGKKGGEADKESQAREQYFFFRDEVETAHANVLRADAKLKKQLKEFEAQLPSKDKVEPEIELPR